jgi:hypothetical protein
MSGNVHVHFVYYGSDIPKTEFEKTAREAYADAGFSSVRQINNPNKVITSKNRARVERAVCEALGYTVKAPAPLDEKWFDGRREVIQPELTARWEVATRGLHLRGRFGAFRHEASSNNGHGSNALAGSNHVTSHRSEPVCCNCGSCNSYETRKVDTHAWVSRCHSRGERAFGASRVEPPAKEKRHKHRPGVPRLVQ